MSTDGTLMTESGTAYDSVPYRGLAYDFTLPSALMAMGRLFGMAPPAVEKARVLELGCANGINLLPMAERWPAATFLGIDASARQTERATQLARDAKLRNVEFRQLDILDIGPDLGTFDYIICHGVLSWVPPAVQDKIFDICGQLLSPLGVAMVSYNALPGWHMVRAIREMLLFHCARFTDPAAKAAQAVAFLEFLRDCNQGNAAYGEVLAAELALISQADASYLLHDHMETENHQFYFNDVVARAARVGLQYLGDAEPETMFLGNLPEQAGKLLAGVDLITQEQYMDFLRNRRFRKTLLCHADVALVRDVPTGWLLQEGLSVAAQFSLPEGGVHLDRDEPVVWPLAKGREVTTHNRGATALMQVMAERHPIEVAAAVEEAVRRVGEIRRPQVEQTARDMGGLLIVSGALRVHSHLAAVTPATADATRPLASPLTRLLAAENEVVITPGHGNLTLNPAERMVLTACDGTRDRADLIDVLLRTLTERKLSLYKDGRELAEATEREAEAGAVIDSALAAFRAHGVISG